jgi:hypothetical protein
MFNPGVCSQFCVDLKINDMKKLHTLLLILAIVTAGLTKTTAQTHQEKTAKVFINKKGEINDENGTKLGFIDKDNIVKDNTGKKLYFIDKDGNVIDSQGKTLGKAQKNGFYYNNKGENVLQTKDLDKEKCAILDPQGHNLGTVHKNYKLHACAAHCFFLEQEKKKEALKKVKS